MMTHTSPRPTALIAEDEPLLAQSLREELSRLWPELNVVATVGDGLSAVREGLRWLPDVLFFDIRMPGQTGLEAASELAESWPTDRTSPEFPQLVLVTAYDNYAVAAFEAQAMDYLLKPVQTERLKATIQRIQKRLLLRSRPGNNPGQQSPAQSKAFDDALAQIRNLMELGTSSNQTSLPKLTMIQAGVGNAIQMIAIQDVIYVEAADKYLRVLTATREYLIRTALKDLLAQLDPDQFWQIHRGLIVQAAQIATVERDESGRTSVRLRQRSEKLAVSRLYAHRFRAM